MLETSSLPSTTAASSPLLCKPRSVHTPCKSSLQVQEHMYSPAMSVHIVQSSYIVPIIVLVSHLMIFQFVKLVITGAVAVICYSLNSTNLPLLS